MTTILNKRTQINKTSNEETTNIERISSDQGPRQNYPLSSNIAGSPKKLERLSRISAHLSEEASKEWIPNQQNKNGIYA